MKNLLYLLMILPFAAKAQKDTLKIVMLVSDTSTVKNNPGYQDTRPFMMYGYQTKKGELLDAYKQKLSKNIVMWIAYKTN